MAYNTGPQRSSKKAELEKILDILWDRDCETFQPFVCACACTCVCVLQYFVPRTAFSEVLYNLFS